jgi:hypothetical protein
MTDVLTLSEQLDAMLLGWLERRCDERRPVHAGDTASAILTVATGQVDEIQAFCRRWGLRLRRLLTDTGVAAVRIDGPALPVTGLTEITAMYRR